jgi:hypothetical protein
LNGTYGYFNAIKMFNTIGKLDLLCKQATKFRQRTIPLKY